LASFCGQKEDALKGKTMITKHLPHIHPRSGAPEAHGHFMVLFFLIDRRFMPPAYLH